MDFAARLDLELITRQPWCTCENPYWCQGAELDEGEKHMDMDEEELLGRIGPTAVGYYTRLDGWGQHRVRVWAAALKGMEEDEFVEGCAESIEASLTSARPIVEVYVPGYAFEARRRLLAAGHDPGCCNGSLYGIAYDKVMEDNHRPKTGVYSCECAGMRHAE